MQFQKWLDQIDPQNSIADAGELSLHQRLSAVSYYLLLAADHPDQSDEHVHQLRVWCRRSIAAVGLYEELLSPAEVKWFRKSLRRTRKAAGEARDLDVLIHRYRERRKKSSFRDLLKYLRKQRSKAQRPIVKLHDRMAAEQRFDRHMDHLIHSIDRRGSTAGNRFQGWAEKKLHRSTANFFSALPGQTPTLTHLHRFRVAGKELRYSMELLSTAFPSTFREVLYPMVSELQTKLGALNDHAAARRRLKRLAEKRPSKLLKKLDAEEKRATIEAREEFDRWWTPERMNDFFRTLHQITHTSRAS